MNRQKLSLFILLILLVVAIAYAFFRTPQQKKVDRLKYSPGALPATAPVNTAIKADDTKLHLELLDDKTASFSGFKRNIFRLAPLKPKVTIPPPPPPPTSAPPTPPPPPPPPGKGELARAEMAKFKFLGFLKKDNRKTIFLSRNNEILLVKKGDKIAGQFEVADITEEFLTINAVPDGGQIVIPLLENMPLLQKK